MYAYMSSGKGKKNDYHELARITLFLTIFRYLIIMHTIFVLCSDAFYKRSSQRVCIYLLQRYYVQYISFRYTCFWLNNLSHDLPWLINVSAQHLHLCCSEQHVFFIKPRRFINYAFNRAKRITGVRIITCMFVRARILFSACLFTRIILTVICSRDATR